MISESPLLQTGFTGSSTTSSASSAPIPSKVVTVHLAPTSDPRTPTLPTGSSKSLGERPPPASMEPSGTRVLAATETKRGSSGPHDDDSVEMAEHGRGGPSTLELFQASEPGTLAGSEPVEDDPVALLLAERQLTTSEIARRKQVVLKQLRRELITCQLAYEAAPWCGRSAEKQALDRAWARWRLARAAEVEVERSEGGHIRALGVLPHLLDGELFIYVGTTSHKDQDAVRSVAAGTDVGQRLHADWVLDLAEGGAQVTALPQRLLRPAGGPGCVIL